MDVSEAAIGAGVCGPTRPSTGMAPDLKYICIIAHSRSDLTTLLLPPNDPPWVCDLVNYHAAARHSVVYSRGYADGTSGELKRPNGYKSGAGCLA